MMKKHILLFFFAFNSLFVFAQEEVTTYYLIRHAEKDRTDKTNRNPSLTTKGKKRAAYWAKILSTANIDMIYTTNYNRTKETALPLAKKNGLKINTYSPNDLYNKNFKLNTKGKNVLIVGHSNTTPAFVNKIIGEKKFKEMKDNNNNNLYIVTVTEKGITSVLLNIEFNQ